MEIEKSQVNRNQQNLPRPTCLWTRPWQVPSIAATWQQKKQIERELVIAVDDIFVVWDRFGFKISTFLWWFYHLLLGGFNPLVKLDHFHLASILHDHHLIHCCIVVGDKSFVWFMRCHVWLWIYIYVHGCMQGYRIACQYERICCTSTSMWFRLSKPHLYVKSSNTAYINTYMCLYTCNL